MNDHELNHRFWILIQANWTTDERASLRTVCEIWMNAYKGVKQ